MEKVQHEGKEQITVCIKCKNFLNIKPNSIRKDFWFNHLCEAVKLPTKVNPYNGKIMPYTANEFGREIFVHGREHEHCRDVNYGNCLHYDDAK